MGERWTGYDHCGSLAGVKQVLAQAPTVALRPTPLARLDRGAHIVLTDKHPLSRTFTYRIGRGGPPYSQIRFRFRIRIAASAQGFGYVNALTDDLASASAEFKVQKDAKGKRSIFWDTVNTQGESDHTTQRATIGVDFGNYVRTQATRPGLHRLRFQLQEYQGFRVKDVGILPSTTLRRTASPPFPATMYVTQVDRRSPGLGKPFTVAVTLGNRGSDYLREATVTIQPDPRLRLNDPLARKPWPAIPPHRGARRLIGLTPVGTGAARVLFTLRSSGGDAVGALDLVIPRPRADDRNQIEGRAGLIAVVILCAMTWLVLWTRLKSRRLIRSRWPAK